MHISFYLCCKNKQTVTDNCFLLKASNYQQQQVNRLNCFLLFPCFYHQVNIKLIFLSFIHYLYEQYLPEKFTNKTKTQQLLLKFFTRNIASPLPWYLKCLIDIPINLYAYVIEKIGKIISANRKNHQNAALFSFFSPPFCTDPCWIQGHRGAEKTISSQPYVKQSFMLSLKDYTPFCRLKVCLYIPFLC